MYAIIQTGGKQYKVQVGDEVLVEKLDVVDGATVVLDVLLVSDDAGIRVGKPIVEGVAVKAKVLEQVKGDKVVVFKYKPKKDFRKKQGHRQPYTKLEILSIG